MELRTLVVALIAICNFAAETLEKVVSGDGEEDVGGKSRRRSRSRKEPEEEDEEEKPQRRSRAKKEPEEEDDDPKDDDSDDGDNPSEDDIIDAVRAAQKVLEKDDVVAVIRKYGKCDRASKVPADRRQKVIDALEKAVDEAA